MRSVQTLMTWKWHLRKYVDWCAYCGKTAEYIDEFHLEHMVPRSKGGPDEPWNLTLACKPCNLRKGVRDWHRGEFTITVATVHDLKWDWCYVDDFDGDYRSWALEVMEQRRQQLFQAARRAGITPDWSLDEVEIYYTTEITPEPAIDVRWMLNLGAAS